MLLGDLRDLFNLLFSFPLLLQPLFFLLQPDRLPHSLQLPNQGSLNSHLDLNFEGGDDDESSSYHLNTHLGLQFETEFMLLLHRCLLFCFQLQVLLKQGLAILCSLG